MCIRDRNTETELSEIFKDLKRNREKIFAEYEYESSMIKTKKVSLISNPIHNRKKEPRLWYQLKEMMKEAKERVYIHTPYVVLNEKMYGEIKEIGSDIFEFKMLINSVAGGDNFMASSDYIFNKEKVIGTGEMCIRDSGCSGNIF